MDKSQRRTATFIVRFWVEYLEETPSAYRGEIESVQNGAKIPFAGLNALISLLQEQAPAPVLSGEEQS